MAFPSEFPQSALLEVLKGTKADLPHLVLAGYDLLGFGLYTYFGDVKYMPEGAFEVIQAATQSTELAGKIQARAIELRATGLPTWLLIITLLREFGPVILQLVQTIRDLFNKQGA